MLPDDGFKSAQFHPKIDQNEPQQIFRVKRAVFQISQKSPNIWDTFVVRNPVTNAFKIAQSGHTDLSFIFCKQVSFNGGRA